MWDRGYTNVDVYHVALLLILFKDAGIRLVLEITRTADVNMVDDLGVLFVTLLISVQSWIYVSQCRLSLDGWIVQHVQDNVLCLTSFMVRKINTMWNI